MMGLAGVLLHVTIVSVYLSKYSHSKFNDSSNV